MVTEKILAAGEAQATAAASAMRGHKKHVVAGKALNVYRKRVRATRLDSLGLQLAFARCQ
jgi:hypothetical protein